MYMHVVIITLVSNKNAGEIFNVAFNNYKGNDVMEIMDKCLKENRNAIHEKGSHEQEPIRLAVLHNRDIKIVQYLLENGAITEKACNVSICTCQQSHVFIK